MLSLGVIQATISVHAAKPVVFSNLVLSPLNRDYVRQSQGTPQHVLLLLYGALIVTTTKSSSTQKNFTQGCHLSSL